MTNFKWSIAAAGLTSLFLFSTHSPCVSAVTPPVEMRKDFGGYDEVSVDDEGVLMAADFAVNALIRGESTPGLYTFPLPVPPNNDGLTSDLLNVEVVTASRQVVAGMNYDILVKLSKEDSCLGAFRAIVWDHFGDLEVTTWGEEVSCVAVAVLQKMSNN